MKTKSFTSETVAVWLATFYKFSSREEYHSKLNAIRCVFNAEGDPEFWDEVSEKAKELMNEK